MGAYGSLWNGWVRIIEAHPPSHRGRVYGGFLGFDGSHPFNAWAGPGIPLVGEPAPPARANEGAGLKDMPHGSRVASAGPCLAKGIGFRVGDCGTEDSTHGIDCARSAAGSLWRETDWGSGALCRYLPSRESASRPGPGEERSIACPVAAQLPQLESPPPGCSRALLPRLWRGGQRRHSASRLQPRRACAQPSPTKRLLRELRRRVDRSAVGTPSTRCFTCRLGRVSDTKSGLGAREAYDTMQPGHLRRGPDVPHCRM
jgi:hypothetical protein